MKVKDRDEEHREPLASVTFRLSPFALGSRATKQKEAAMAFILEKLEVCPRAVDFSGKYYLADHLN